MRATPISWQARSTTMPTFSRPYAPKGKWPLAMSFTTPWRLSSVRTMACRTESGGVSMVWRVATSVRPRTAVLSWDMVKTARHGLPVLSIAFLQDRWRHLRE